MTVSTGWRFGGGVSLHGRPAGTGGDARRAGAVQEYLISRGVGANRIRTVSYGKERPAATCSDESCFSQNRRVVTVVQPGAGT